MRRFLNAAVLAFTALALVATSVPHEPPSCTAGSLVPGPTTLAVETTCGPAGAVTATLDPESCELALDGAAVVGLPSSGRLDGASLTLRDRDAIPDRFKWNQRRWRPFGSPGGQREPGGVRTVLEGPWRRRFA